MYNVLQILHNEERTAYGNETIAATITSCVWETAPLRLPWLGSSEEAVCWPLYGQYRCPGVVQELQMWITSGCD